MRSDARLRIGAFARLGDLSIFPVMNVMLITAYVIVYVYFRDMLPEKWSVDSGKIVEILSYGDGGNLDNSFAATAAFFSLVGLDNLDLFTVGISVIFLIIATHGTRAPLAFVQRWLLILPCVMLNMFAPSKETIVLIIAMLISGPAIYFRGSRRFSWAAFIVCYLTYGILVRKYYLLIAGLFLLIYYVWPRRGSVKLLVSGMIFCVLLASPSGVLETLQSPRDTSNAYAESIGSDNRTAFTNLVPPTNGPNFLINYAYAAVLLLAPIVFFHTPTDAFMQFVMITVLAMLFKARKKLKKSTKHSAVRFFASLIVSHILIQIIFEPDLGSFTRHLSSVFLYLIAMQIAGAREKLQ